MNIKIDAKQESDKSELLLKGMYFPNNHSKFLVCIVLPNSPPS